jgi:hypothetical protein
VNINGGAMTAEIFGREEELKSIRAFLASLEDGAGSLTLEGEPGIADPQACRAAAAPLGAKRRWNLRKSL